MSDKLHESPDQVANDLQEQQEVQKELAQPFKLEYLDSVDEFPYQTTIDFFGDNMTVNYKVISIGERLATKGDLVSFEKVIDYSSSNTNKSAEEIMQQSLDETDIILQHIKACVEELQDASFEQIKRIHPLDLNKLYDLTAGAVKPHSFRKPIP